MQYRLAIVIKEGYIRSSAGEPHRPIFGTPGPLAFVDDQDSWETHEDGQNSMIPLDDSFWRALGLSPSIFGPEGNLVSEF